MMLVIIITAFVTIAIFIYFNYATQKRREKQDNRRDEINGKIVDILKAVKSKETDVK